MEDSDLTDLPRQRSLHRQHLDLPPPARTTVNNLYPEILALIFSYLEVRDKGRAAQVCLAWRDASYHKSVWRGTEAKLRLARACPTLFHSLVRRGIRKVRVSSLGISGRRLRGVVEGIPNLESLNLSGCNCISDGFLCHAFPCELLTLTKLDLSLCKSVTDYSLGTIAKNLKNLEVLELGVCCNITNEGLFFIACGLKNLKRLNLSSCCNISDQGLLYVSGINIEKADASLILKFLGLQDCQELSDKSLPFISIGLTNLKSIDLSCCKSVSDSCLKYLAKMPNLRELNLSGCKNISDIGMAYLSEGGSLVSSLDVSFCDKVGDQALMHLSQGLKQLRSIDLYGCRSITSAGIKRIMKLPQLSSLNLHDDKKEICYLLCYSTFSKKEICYLLLLS